MKDSSVPIRMCKSLKKKNDLKLGEYSEWKFYTKFSKKKKFVKKAHRSHICCDTIMSGRDWFQYDFLFFFVPPSQIEHNEIPMVLWPIRNFFFSSLKLKRGIKKQNSFTIRPKTLKKKLTQNNLYFTIKN